MLEGLPQQPAFTAEMPEHLRPAVPDVVPVVPNPLPEMPASRGLGRQEISVAPTASMVEIPASVTALSQERALAEQAQLLAIRDEAAAEAARIVQSAEQAGITGLEVPSAANAPVSRANSTTGIFAHKGT